MAIEQARQRVESYRSAHAGRSMTMGRGSRALQQRASQLRRKVGEVDDARLAQALGWLSVGLGLTEILAPRLVGNAIGVGYHPVVFRALGARELASGIGLLTQRKAGSWAWSRVAGDAMDLALLGAATGSRHARPQRIALAATAVLGVTALDVYSGQKLTQSRLQFKPPRIEISQAVTIDAPPEKLYEFWRSLENLPKFVRDLESVSITGEKSSHWVMRTVQNAHVEWDSEITQDEQNRKIAWRTLPGAEVRHSGIVSFGPAPAGRGTVVRVRLRYEPPAGMIGSRIAALLGRDPGLRLEDDLLRFKQLIETGEIATTEGQPHGQRSLLGRKTLGRWLS